MGDTAGSKAASEASVTRADGSFRSEVREGMRVDWDVPFRMADGTIVRANIYRPIDQTRRVGTLATTGVYGKDFAFQEGYATVWKMLCEEHPEGVAGSTNVHQNWEVVDPERWVPKGFAVVRVDARGCGTSDGYLDPFGLQEREDFAVIIQRLSEQPWSNGNIGCLGISYYAVMSWGAAASAPPALKAIAAWEGCNDFYRETMYHGGILCQLIARWFPIQVTRVQRGNKGLVSRATGRSVTGPDAYTPKQLVRNRFPTPEEAQRRKFDGQFYRDRSSKIENVKCAVLTAGNWGGQGLHLRGNIEGYLRAENASARYLELHGLEHWTHFVTAYGEGLLTRFFGHYLNGEDTGWDQQPPISLQIRHPGEKFEQRAEKEWPLARTRWTKLYLQPEGLGLSEQAPGGEAALSYDPLEGPGLKFSTPPLQEPLEITGPLAAKLFVSSATTDADIFLVVRVFDPAGQEVLFSGTTDPHTPIAQGWLRASHRKLDKDKSLPYRPYHTHDTFEPLEAGKPVELDVEIWPTCLVIPAGYTLVLQVRGKDFDYTEDQAGLEEQTYAGETVLTGMRGCGPFVHADPCDRPPAIFGGEVTLHFSAKQRPYVLLPVIPKASG